MDASGVHKNASREQANLESAHHEREYVVEIAFIFFCDIKLRDSYRFLMSSIIIEPKLHGECVS